jgi:hypothetical protein
MPKPENSSQRCVRLPALLTGINPTEGQRPDECHLSATQTSAIAASGVDMNAAEVLSMEPSCLLGEHLTITPGIRAMQMVATSLDTGVTGLVIGSLWSTALQYYHYRL